MFQRQTRQRQIILEELRKVASHPTASEIYDLVRQRLPNLSLGTVYRNLDLLARLGRIQKFEWAGGEARFDGDVRKHDHVRCLRCGRVDDVGGPPLDIVPEVENDFHGYKLLGHRLEYLGVCLRCQTSNKSNLKGETDHA